ncbi:DUF922 domain-containing protein [Ichthyenterobacterium magnum]|uniref:Uncharacterized protein DUF922 n=1 Tax=Ichthyenterobacterium magnum TaxID=1230530 RepID=A0A420DUY0_9FLAO|nr:DUF922 domain-containing protein [Ichthyenterobacterium magnum]RKE98045.1 uncharacterized protein DUF922 [Ichthyenterobacterium magnum]
MIYKALLFCLLFFNGASNDEVTISWTDDYKLTWDDFKGPIKPNTAAAAITASGITFGYSVKTSNGKIVSFNPSVEAHFYPEKSWYIKEKGNARLLAHEQLHFDITELHVRKFRAEISKLSITQNLRNELSRLHQRINDELAIMQSQYDSQTDNSINVKVQEQWEYLVAKALKEFEAYKSE